MRVVYQLIAVFLVLCVFFARWYLCDVRGLCAFPASNEILFMLLAALVIGFAGSWLLRETSFSTLQKQGSLLAREKATLKTQLGAMEKEIQFTRRHLYEWQQEANMLKQQRSAREELIREAQSKIASLEVDLEQYQLRHQSLQKEYDEALLSLEKVKKELEEERSRKEEVVTEKKESPNTSNVEGSVEEQLEAHELFRSRFTPSTWQTKDDLSLISGIGPVIHKKLNELGIYSFQQISELTPAMVRRITSALKYFPDRIGRDNWIGQAAAFLKRR